MSIDFNILASKNYATLINDVNDTAKALVKMALVGDENGLPVGAVRLHSDKWQKWDGSSWNDITIVNNISGNAETVTNGVYTLGNQTIAGIKTFSSVPVLPASNPTTDNQAVRRKYVTDNFALSSHNHNGIYEPVFSKNNAFNKSFGTASGTVSQGNHTHAIYALLTGATFSGLVDFAGALNIFNTHSTRDGIRLNGSTGGSSTRRISVYPKTLTTNRIQYLPNSNGDILVDTGSLNGINGYLKFSNGLIIQWSSYSANANDQRTVTFPTAFPTACRFVIHTMTGQQNNGYIPRVNNITKTSFYATYDIFNGAANPSCTHYWFAVGY